MYGNILSRHQFQLSFCLSKCMQAHMKHWYQTPSSNYCLNHYATVGNLFRQRNIKKKPNPCGLFWTNDLKNLIERYGGRLCKAMAPAPFCIRLGDEVICFEAECPPKPMFRYDLRGFLLAVIGFWVLFTVGLSKFVLYLVHILLGKLSLSQAQHAAALGLAMLVLCFFPGGEPPPEGEGG